MRDAWCPDGTASRAVLFGTAEYRSSELTSIPAVRENLTGLRAALTTPERGLLAPPHCRVVGDGEPPTMSGVGAALAGAAQEATDLLLVYYAGHGLLDEDGRLYLTLPHTEPDTLGFSAIPVELVLRLVGRARARARVLILDCCFSGRAVAAMASPSSVAAGRPGRSGTYTLTSTTHTAPSFAPPGEPHTTFTGALLRALAAPEPLTLDEIHAAVDAELAARGLPRPQRRAVNAAGDLTLVRGRGPTDREPAGAPGTAVPPAAVFGRPPARHRVRTSARLFARASLLAVAPITYVLWVPLEAGPSALYTTVMMLALTGVAATPVGRPRLTVHAAGLSVTVEPVSRVRSDIPWTDIAYVGLLHRARLASGDAMLTFENIVVVRQRAGVPVPHLPSRVGNGGLEALGYVSVGTLDQLGADPVLLRDAVLRFAPGRYRTNSELLELDPRLIPLA